MALDDLLAALDRLDDETDRVRYVESVLRRPDHQHQTAIPDGAPEIEGHWPDNTEIDAFTTEQNGAWARIFERFTITPEVLEEAHFEYESNIARLHETNKIPESARAQAPLSNLPHYRGRTLLRKVKESIPLWERDPITVESIEQNRLGKGGYSDVHMLTEPDGHKSIIKFFRPSYLLPSDLRESRENRIELIKENLFENRKFFSQDRAFANLRSIPLEFDFYIGDYIEGTHLNEHFGTDDERVRIGLSGLADALAKIHDREMLFVDVKPDSVLITNNGDVRICDYDFCMSETRLVDTRDQFRLVKAPIYRPRESFDSSLPVGRTADLEQLAYVIDHAYNNSTFLDPTDFTDSADRAMQNMRSYPEHRAMNVPEPVRDLVQGMLTYPRDESITAKDFAFAIERSSIE